MNSKRDEVRRNSHKTSSKKKYLGEIEDPHFVPRSPIISRQSLSDEQEEELTRSCTLVLSGVQHTDDNDDDPLMKYISNHITTKPKTVYPKEKPTHSKPSTGAATGLSGQSQKRRQANDDSATPSNSSKRDTIDRTDTSTPMTMLSDSGQNAPSQHQHTSGRNDLRSSKSQAFHASTTKKHPYEMYQEIPAASRSVTHLTALEQAIEEQIVSVALLDKAANLNISHVEFNKNLPPVPNAESLPSKEKQNSFSRIFRPGRTRAPKTGTLVMPPDSTTKSILPTSSKTEAATLPKSKFSLAALFERGKRKNPGLAPAPTPVPQY